MRLSTTSEDDCAKLMQSRLQAFVPCSLPETCRGPLSCPPPPVQGDCCSMRCPAHCGPRPPHAPAVKLIQLSVPSRCLAQGGHRTARNLTTESGFREQLENGQKQQRRTSWKATAWQSGKTYNSSGNCPGPPGESACPPKPRERVSVHTIPSRSTASHSPSKETCLCGDCVCGSWCVCVVGVCLVGVYVCVWLECVCVAAISTVASEYTSVTCVPSSFHCCWYIHWISTAKPF